MTDPYPGVLFETVLRMLADRYGGNNVQHLTEGGDVVIHMRVPGRETPARFHFTWPQAKFLAFNPIDPLDIEAGRFPPGWPN